MLYNENIRCTDYLKSGEKEKIWQKKKQAERTL